MLGHTSYASTADTNTTVLPEAAYQAAEATAHLVLTVLRNAEQLGTRPGLPRIGPGFRLGVGEPAA